MSEQRLLDALGQVDDQFITEAAPGQREIKPAHWKKWVILAACLCILIFVVSQTFNGQPQVSYSPPLRLPIQSIQDFEDLMNSTQLPDDALNDYLAEKGYASFGFDTRDEVNEFASPFRETGYLAVTDTVSVQGFSLQYFPQEPRYNITYRIDDISYSFQYTNFEKETKRPGMIPVKTYVIDGSSIDLYQGYNGLVGELHINNYQIRITVNGYSNIDDVTFDQFRLKYPA